MHTISALGVKPSGINCTPGSKSEALQLGVHLIPIYFIRISFFSVEIFFYFGGGWSVVGDVWVPFFGFSNHMILIWYILKVSMYISSYSDNYRQNSCRFAFVIRLIFFFNYFQNQTAMMIFSKKVFNFTVVEGIFET